MGWFIYSAYTADQLKALRKIRPTFIAKSGSNVIGSVMCVIHENTHKV
jgi:hypothetical protein